MTRWRGEGGGDNAVVFWWSKIITTAVDTVAEQQVGTVTGGDTDTELFLETPHTWWPKLTWADCC